ncbi:alpha-L-rhamnosidase-related protein [Aquisphaera insulae]|uniref:alpha-L-rhamnosidase-related protein n=1 Tax=Aquisphaera insulae TaxID=2712864 RepID=UPI0013EB2433|nr:alpha-L-rhamnosidase N-terminal domain-containing protein [Aquisphaera insulae]
MIIRCVRPLAVFLALAVTTHAGAALDKLPPLAASWIWLDRDTPPAESYNLVILARRDLSLEAVPRTAVLRVTADTYYRLSINGQWVADGPGRGWPDHFEYDVLDVTRYLRPGTNQVEILARYYGVGDFHHVPQRPGLLAQLDAADVEGSFRTLLTTDSSWQAAEATAYVRNTPKVSIQMEPFEIHDARHSADAEAPRWSAARVVAATTGGPWSGLRPRDVLLLTRKPFPIKSFLAASVVSARGTNFCLPAAVLMHPGLIEANNHTAMSCGMATVLENARPITLDLETDGLDAAIDGKPIRSGTPVSLEPGKHLVLAYVSAIYTHNKEQSFRIRQTDGYTLSNPLDPAHENPWCFLPYAEFAAVGSDQTWNGFTAEVPRLKAASDGFSKARAEALRDVTNLDAFRTALAPRARLLSSSTMFVLDPYWQFTHRKVEAGHTPKVDHPEALTAAGPAGAAVVHPSAGGDVELLYDLGEQNVGHYDLELDAPAGATIDIFGVEYLAPDGRIQFTGNYRNGMRFITREGLNRYTSLKRRSQRFLFVTFRGLTAPATIRKLRLIESTYPVQPIGSFAASDERLTRIFDISTRTLKLCMEDTFTDCPLYEQTHWVGDARNESLFAYNTFGAHDLALRCIRLTAESVGRLPIAGCQTPSCWDVLIPNWSFLWGLSVWDYYAETGDADAVRPYWPAVVANLKGTEKLLNDRDLLSAPYWNFFDWTGIDSAHHTVLHNSLFCVGAIDAAKRLGHAVGDHSQDAWLDSFRGRLVAGINRTWNAARGAYPDSIHEDGSISPSTSQHTSFLALLYDVVPPEARDAAVRNTVAPPEGTVKVGSPFAALYLYHALEKIGRDDAIIASIRENYLPMLDAGATTVWESYASGTTGGGGFPTRSHCHAWSSAPNYYLPRIILGYRATAPGAAEATISPRPSGLSWARGTVATARGPVVIDWKLDGKTLTVTCRSPAGMTVHFARNPALEGKTIVFNGRPVD